VEGGHRLDDPGIVDLEFRFFVVASLVGGGRDMSALGSI
jgi:hypothetical protein